MTTTLMLSGRAIHKHVQSLMGLIFRPSSASSIQGKSETKNSSNNNASIQPVFHNRNPRNLELMTIAPKPEGYHLDDFVVTFWHKLTVTASTRDITVEITHNNGSKVITASSREFAIRRFLYKPSDWAAYKAVGKVIAQRCLESGINSVYCDTESQEGTKLAVLFKEIEEGGLSLTEPKSYSVPLPHSRRKPSKPWDIVP